MVSALNANNASIPSGPSAIHVYSAESGQSLGLLCHKLNNAYGGATGFGHPYDGATKRRALTDATWIAL